MTEAELDRRLFNGEAVEAALELFAENQRLLSSEPSEGERETRRRVAGAAFDIGASIVDKRDAEIAALKAEVAKRDRALAAGPAALRRYGDEDICARAALAEVEAAQAAAMKDDAKEGG